MSPLKTRAVNGVLLQICCGYKYTQNVVTIKYNSKAWCIKLIIHCGYSSGLWLYIQLLVGSESFKCHVIVLSYLTKSTAMTALVFEGDMAQYTL
jgi:hypothetical protein